MFAPKLPQIPQFCPKMTPNPFLHVMPQTTSLGEGNAVVSVIWANFPTNSLILPLRLPRIPQFCTSERHMTQFSPKLPNVVPMHFNGKLQRRISRERWQIRSQTQQRSYRKPPMAFRLRPSHLTLDDLERSKVKVTYLCRLISRKPWHYVVGPNRSRIGNRLWVIDCNIQIWPWMTLRGQRSRSQYFDP